VLITHNTVTAQQGCSWCNAYEGAGLEADGYSTNVTFTYNISANNQGAGIIGNVGSNIYYNLVHGNASAATPFYSACGIMAGSTSNVYNNTVYGNYYSGIHVTPGPSGATINVKNNALMNNGNIPAYGYEIWVETGVNGYTGDYNLVYTTGTWALFMDWLGAYPSTNWADWKTTSSQDANSVNANPLFTNPSVGDFTFQAGSPAIGAGVYIPGVSTANPPNIGAK
jgi:hypothetical protein